MADNRRGGPSANSSPAVTRKDYAAVHPSYSKVSERLRRISSGSLQCSLFCGGQRCKYESAGRWSAREKALDGLFSHWVREDLLAMARPSTAHFRKNRFIEQLKRVGINTVINLQLPWEHSRCGPGLETSSGFTYRPEDLMKHGVYFYNYGWMDYGVPTLESVLDTVKVLDFALRDGKVAVHCHAGLGRTGVLIACYLVYSQRYSGEEAITVVRGKRPGSIQTRPQIELVKQFAAFILPLWNMYPTRSENSLNLSDYLRNQSLLLHGEEKRKLKHTPKVVQNVCAQLVRVTKQREAEVPHCFNGGELGAEESRVSASELNNEETLRLTTIQSQMNGTLKWSLLSQESSPAVLISLLSCYFRGLGEPCLTVHDLPALKLDGDSSNLPVGSYSTFLCVVDALKPLTQLRTPEGSLLAECRHLASSLLQTSATEPATRELSSIIQSHLN